MSCSEDEERDRDERGPSKMREHLVQCLQDEVAASIRSVNSSS
jgi:hypothetical protein